MEHVLHVLEFSSIVVVPIENACANVFTVMTDECLLQGGEGKK